MKKHHVIGAAIVAMVLPLVLIGAAAGRSAKSGVAASGSARAAGVSGTVTFDGVWTGSEAASFGKVIKAFNKVYPNVKIKYNPLGNNVSTVLSTSIAGGHPPDMADIAQPGYVKQLVQQGHLKPITYAAPAIGQNFSAGWRTLGTFSGKLYALVFKASNKSLLWYNVPAFKAAGVQAPKTWAQLITASKTLLASGTPAFSIGGADGWTLTDLFENIYLRTFGPTAYAKLTAHQIKWTDPTVITALKEMAQIVGTSSDMAGGTSGALQYGFNDSVTNAFGSPAKAAIVFEGDFVSGVIQSSTKSKAGSGYQVVPFPTIKPGPGASGVEVGGDLFVTFNNTPAVQAFVKFLATPAAANAWAADGGFASGNHNVNLAVFPTAIDKANQVAMGKAQSVVFDMSDEQPASFGATTGQGEWGIFQTFLKNPANVTGIAKQLESAATAAYKKGK